MLGSNHRFFSVASQLFMHCSRASSFSRGVFQCTWITQFSAVFCSCSRLVARSKLQKPHVTHPAPSCIRAAEDDLSITKRGKDMGTLHEFVEQLAVEVV